MRNPRPVEVAERLEAAAGLLDTKGWCRYQSTDWEGHHCVAGALYKVARKHAASYLDTFGEYLLFEAGQPQYAHYGAGQAIMWNDRQKDKRKVTRHLRRCAKLIRQNHSTDFASV